VPSTEGPWLIDGNASAIPYGLQEGCNPSWGDEEVIEVDPNDRWVSINWIGASTFKTLQPSIDEHEMWIYEVDGHYIEPRKASTMLLWAGERYSGMIRLDRTPKDYSIRAIDGGYSQMIGAFGILRYKGGEPGNAEPDRFNVTTTSTPHFGYNAWPVGQPTFLDKNDLHPFPPKAPARYADDLHVLELGKANATWQFTLSGKKQYPPDWSAYKPLLYNLESPEAHDQDLVIRTKNGTWVDIVLQVGSSALWPVDFPHAIHKHANKFWRIGFGNGVWKYGSMEEAIAEHPENFNLVDPPYRDTFLTEFTGAMWVALRYQVTNPGAWLVSGPRVRAHEK
jgi:FtsP/CotA-like multicopper oxidase with cupredoxin domain